MISIFKHWSPFHGQLGYKSKINIHQFVYSYILKRQKLPVFIFPDTYYLLSFKTHIYKFIQKFSDHVFGTFYFWAKYSSSFLKSYSMYFYFLSYLFYTPNLLYIISHILNFVKPPYLVYVYRNYLHLHFYIFGYLFF